MRPPVLLNVAALPPPVIADQIARLSARTLAAGGTLLVDGQERYPHLTLYMTRFPDTALEQIVAAIEEALGDIRRVEAIHDGYYVTPGLYYEVSYQRTDELLRLHWRVTRSLHGLRYLAATPMAESYFGLYSEDQRRNVQRWGYDLAGSLFRPHITVTRFTAAVGEELPQAAMNLSFTLDRLGLFEADGDGAARRLINVFSVGGS